MKRIVAHLFPHNRRDWIHLWFSGSIALIVAMILKEVPISERSGGHLSFHWTYDLGLFVAAASLIAASGRVHSRTLAFVGYSVATAGIVYLFRPVY